MIQISTFDTVQYNGKNEKILFPQTKPSKQVREQKLGSIKWKRIVTVHQI